MIVRALLSKGVYVFGKFTMSRKTAWMLAREKDIEIAESLQPE